MNTTHRIIALACAPALFAGCLGTEADVSESEHALFRGGTLWPTSEIRVCFETGLDTRTGQGSRRPASSEPFFDEYRAWMRDAVEDSWGRASNLRFTHWGDCPSRNDAEMSGWIAISWGTENHTTIGYLSNSWTRMQLTIPRLLQVGEPPDSSRREFQAMVRHSFGHALGFAHELNRADAPHHGAAGSAATCDHGAVSVGTTYTPNDPESVMNYGQCSAATGELSAYDIIGVQRAYGRKPPGSLVGLGGRCANVMNASRAYGTPVVAYDCTGAANDTWTRDAEDRFVVRYLDVNNPARYLTAGVLGVRGNSAAAYGTPAEFQRAEQGASWPLAGVSWRALGERCVGVMSAADSSVLHLQRCDGSSYQSWDFVGDQIRLHGTNLCATDDVADGSRMKLKPCDGAQWRSRQLYARRPEGRLASTRCIDVQGSAPTNWAVVLTKTCRTGAASQSFHVTGAFRALGQCLDMLGGVSENRVPIGVYPCQPGARNQTWDYYW